MATLYELKLRLASPWLGNQRTREAVRRFRRDDLGKIAIDLPQWNWTFKQAALALHMDNIDTDTIRPQANIDPPKFVLYRRNYTHNNKQCNEMFEAMRENSVVTFNMLVTNVAHGSSAPAGKSPPNAEQLTAILKFTGEFLGLSPWGGNYGYGRFNVESLKAV